MSYHPLANETGGTAEQRRAEADRLVNIISEKIGLGEITARELDFVMEMEDAETVSPKQLFWLRDIKDKYL